MTNVLIMKDQQPLPVEAFCAEVFGLYAFALEELESVYAPSGILDCLSTKGHIDNWHLVHQSQFVGVALGALIEDLTKAWGEPSPELGLFVTEAMAYEVLETLDDIGLKLHRTEENIDAIKNFIQQNTVRSIIKIQENKISELAEFNLVELTKLIPEVRNVVGINWEQFTRIHIAVYQRIIENYSKSQWSAIFH